MKSILALCVLCCGILSTSTASASAVGFTGTVTAGGGGSAILGTIPSDPARPFLLLLNFNDGAGFTNFLGSITSGTFSIPAQTFNVTGGSILVAEGGCGRYWNFHRRRERTGCWTANFHVYTQCDREQQRQPG